MLGMDSAPQIPHQGVSGDHRSGKSPRLREFEQTAEQGIDEGVQVLGQCSRIFYLKLHCFVGSCFNIDDVEFSALKLSRLFGRLSP